VLKRIASIPATVLLMALLLLQLQGRWIVFKLQQCAIHLEIESQLRAGIPDAGLSAVKIARVWETEPNDRFERKHDTEFRFDGEMYDVVRSRVQGDTTIYFCIHDTSETWLLDEMEEMIDEGIDHPMDGGKQKQITQWLSLEYDVPGTDLPRPNVGFMLLASHCSGAYPGILPGTVSPPPELRSCI